MCDETNNTGEVIDRNEFVAEIFIKPLEVSTLSLYNLSQPELASHLTKLQVRTEKQDMPNINDFKSLKLAGGGIPISLSNNAFSQACTSWWRNRSYLLFFVEQLLLAYGNGASMCL